MNSEDINKLKEFCDKVIEAVDGIESSKDARVDQRAYDTYANTALHQMLSAYTLMAANTGQNIEINYTAVAEHAWNMADAMMKARRSRQVMFATMEDREGEEGVEVYAAPEGAKS